MDFDISKEELKKMYIKQNLSAVEIANIFNVSEKKVRIKLSKYEIKKPKDLLYKKIKENNIKKYGVENISQLDEVKEKKKRSAQEKYGVDNISKADEIKEKKIKKSLEKFGVKYVLQNESIKNRIKETNLKIYGVSNPMKSKDVNKKAQNTCFKKYGEKFPGQVEEFKEKIKKTNLEKYGVEYVLQNQDIKNKIIETKIKKYGIINNFKNPIIKEKIKETCMKKYNVPYACMIEKCRKANGNSISKINKSFSKILENNNIKNMLEKKINNYSYDIEIINNNILLEINPTYTHNVTYGSEFRGHTKKPLDKDYHLNKTINAQENGYRCIHIFDWEDKEKIINILKDKERIFARKCKINLVDIQEANEFLNKYHLQNTCKGQEIILGLYYNNELVELMSFGKPRYNNKYEWELLRLCSKSNIIGGTKKLFNNFIKKYNPHSIISYCDNSKFSGDIYNKLGFKLLDYGKPSKHWYNIKTKKHITDNLLRQRGYDQLFGTNYGKGTSNEELMIKNGFVELYDCGQSVYIYE